MRTLLIIASVVSLALVACGDDDDSTSDAGTDGGAGTSAGSGGRGGKGGSGSGSGSGSGGSRAGAGGRAGTAGTSAPAGTGASGKGGSGGNSGSTDQITIKFKAKLGNADFACGSKVTGQGSTNATIEPRDFRMFVQDVKLVTNDDKEVALTLDTRSPWQNKDVAELDFEDGTGACTDGDSATNTEITGTVPKGSYKAIVFSNGVPDALNHADPVRLAPPLAASTLTWGWLYGYRFIKLEVAAAVDDAEVAGGLLHLGSTACENTSGEDGGVDFDAPPSIKCSKPNRNIVRLSNYQVGSSVIVANAGAAFAQTDLNRENDCHSDGEACPSIFQSLGVDYSTGSPLSSQTFYSLE